MDTCRKKPEFVAPLPIKGLTAWMTKDGLGFYGMGRNLKGRVGQLCVFGERVIVKKFPKKCVLWRFKSQRHESGLQHLLLYKSFIFKISKKWLRTKIDLVIYIIPTE